MEVKEKRKLTSEEVRVLILRSIDRKQELRRHIESGGKLSELSKDEFKLVKPL